MHKGEQSNGLMHVGKTAKDEAETVEECGWRRRRLASLHLGSTRLHSSWDSESDSDFGSHPPDPAA
jgi:hypothetical protein